MNVRALTVLASLAAVVSLAAVWAVHREVKDWRTPAHGKPVFPGLAERIEDTGKLVVHHAGKQLTILRRDSGWVLQESDGYAVQAKQVQRTLVGLSELRWLEPKTQKPELYAKLEVEDTDAKHAKSRRIEAFDRKGGKFADLIVGRENLQLQTISDGGVYIRKPGEQQAWLAGGQLLVGGEAKDWLVNRIIDIPRTRMAHAVVHHPNGDVITVEKTGTSDPPFKVTGIPSEQKLADKLYPTDIGRALEDFEIYDARRADRVPFPNDRTVTATFTTVEGLVVRLRITTMGEERWAQLDADETKSDTPGVRQAATAVAARAAGWAFRIPEFEAIHVVKPYSKILEPADGALPKK